ncbi:MAG: hypothetical protein U1C58_04850 [Flavobacteriaceae bacterium]|jgi:hypothetical protein|nr:hypothetical protein [Flavobacteriaceae bacterium]MDZ4147593.1 hypothetical protein [Flavobacteriaceae bacterium]
MRIKFTIIICFLFLTSCGQSQTEKITGNPTNDFPKLFDQNSVIVDIMDGLKTDPKQLELTAKLQKAFQENYEWFQEYIKTAEKGQPLKYHTNFGITETEYNEYLKLSGKVEVISSGKETIEIKKNGDNIKFIGQDKTSIFNDLTIDLKNNQILFKNYVLSFVNEINVTDNDNGLKSKWKGYNWEFVNPELNEETDIQTLDEFISISLTIGQLEKNGKTYMQIKERKMINGFKTIDNQVPIMF